MAAFEAIPKGCAAFFAENTVKIDEEK